jgi:hypothetical protein
MKKVIIIILAALVLFLVVIKGLAFWVETNFEARFNSNPDRSYNIAYSELHLDTFLNGITLDNVSIEPLNSQHGAVVRGHVDYATLNGLALNDLIFKKSLNIHEIAFDEPRFEITLSQDTVQNTGEKGLQSMFGDIISSMNVTHFRIDNGSVVLIDPISKAIKGQVKKVNIIATEIDTDSLKFEYIIPFEMEDLQLNLDEISLEINDYTNVELGRLQYKLKDKLILINDLSLGYSIDWIEVSKRVGLQNDIIELNVKEIAIHKFEPSNNFYLNLDVVAQKLSFDNLNIKLQRNKNIPRPSDIIKPSFQGMLKELPISFLMDSVQISNSSITYSELGINKSETGSIKIQNINGIIIGVTNMPEEQKNFGQIEAEIEASLFGKAEIEVKLNIPYDNDTFALKVDVGAMELTNLNPTVKPLARVEMISGKMRRIHFKMNAGPKRSQNRLVFDYDNLHLNVINEKNKDKGEKNVLFSALANGAIRTNNLPGEKKYRVVEYQSKRNQYRSPINYIIQGLIQGFKRIVPGSIARKLIN